MEANVAQELIDLAEQAVLSAKASLVLAVLDRMKIAAKLLACYLSCLTASGSCDSGSCG